MKTNDASIDTAALIRVLEAHVSPPKVKAKDRRRAQQMAAQHRPSANKVSKGSRRDLCTQGGRLSNRFNESGRVKLGKEGIELSLLDERGYHS